LIGILGFTIQACDKDTPDDPEPPPPPYGMPRVSESFTLNQDADLNEENTQ
jgi:hypothetical protein